MFSFRITKYNPEFRDENGAYKLNDWTSVYDIEKEIVTAEEYLRIENKYIDFVKILEERAEGGGFVVTGYETHHSDDFYAKLETRIGKLSPPDCSEGSVLSKDDVLPFCRSILREQCYGRLSKKGRLYVYFGYDYYMYVVSSKRLIVEGIDTELFVEERVCPYHDYDNNI